MERAPRAPAAGAPAPQGCVCVDVRSRTGKYLDHLVFPPPFCTAAMVLLPTTVSLLKSLSLSLSSFPRPRVPSLSRQFATPSLRPIYRLLTSRCSRSSCCNEDRRKKRREAWLQTSKDMILPQNKVCFFFFFCNLH